MRKWVDRFLSEFANEDASIRLVIADVGDFPLFQKMHPKSFVNVGVSESNAIGIAAGLASEGFRVYVYGVSSFFLYRAYEQFKTSIAYWKQRVTFLGVGFGWKYYNIGIGHFCPDDIALVQSLPGMSIYVPYKLSQLKALLTATTDGPRYIRLTANIVDEGFDDTEEHPVEIITYGEMVKNVIGAQALLKAQGVDTGIIAVDEISDQIAHTIHNRGFCTVVVVEDQCRRGGITPLLRELGVDISLCLNLPDLPDKVAVSRQALYESYGLSSILIRDKLLDLIRNE